MEHLFEASGKWILAGEHTVLRGGPAVVFPFNGCGIKGCYSVAEKSLTLHVEGEFNQELRALFWMTLKKALKRKNKNFSDLKGDLTLYNNTKIGVGLGSSATICVILAKYFFILGWVEESEVYEFARCLEDFFHGESSGIDVAGAMAESGLLFYRKKMSQPILLNWQPYWYLSFCGQSGVTSECIYKLKVMGQQNPEELERIDRQMVDSVHKTLKALSMGPEGFAMLVQAIEQAAGCFRQWQLTEGILEKHMEELKKMGASAVKPTGSGGGGYVLSLWKHPPQASYIRDKGLLKAD